MLDGCWIILSNGRNATIYFIIFFFFLSVLGIIIGLLLAIITLEYKFNGAKNMS